MKHLALILAAASLLATPLKSLAQTETLSDSVFGTPNGTTTPESFGTFDTNLGTLESVDILLDLQTASTPELYTFSSDGGSGDVQTGATINIGGLGSTNPLFSATYLSPFESLSSTTGPGLTTGTPMDTEATGSVTYTDATDLSDFESNGPSTLNLSLSTIGEYDNGTDLVNAAGGGTSQYRGVLDVTYTYAVPEPSSWALGLIALGGVFYLRRRQLNA